MCTAADYSIQTKMLKPLPFINLYIRTYLSYSDMRSLYKPLASENVVYCFRSLIALLSNFLSI